MRLWVKRLGLVFRITGVIVAIFIGGFFLFAGMIDRETQAPVEKADGIVALTGGRFRIAAADRLLEAGKGKRLLITGVYEAATRKAIKRLMPRSRSKFRCCVDIDRKARNTIGNAAETRNWVEGHRYSSIIVVTSSYHMPRSLVELRRAIPNVKLIPYVVAPKWFRAGNWWSSPRAARLLFSEYVKLLPALARFGLAHLRHSMTSDQTVRASPGEPSS